MWQLGRGLQTGNRIVAKTDGRPHRSRIARRPRLELLEQRALLTIYNIGPGQAYTTLGSLPWSDLLPGDTVAIHWQAGGYHEKLLISESGTASEPINIVGIPGPDGQQPVIDGENATTSSQFDYYYTPQEESSLVLIQRSADQPYEYLPSYINISGLEFRDAYQAYTFTDATGATQTYGAFAAAIYIEGASNITIANCTLDNSGLGLFALSNGDAAHTTSNVMVEGNYFYGNGVPGSDGEHNSYCEVDGITYQDNDYGPLRAGALGAELKDRSAGVIIRDNYFSPAAHMLDLVDPEDSPTIVAADPAYANTYVYGNIFNNSGPNPAESLVHFGGDSGFTAMYRPNLYFYDNTVVNLVDQSTLYRTIMFELDTSAQNVYASNNIFYNSPVTAGGTPSLFEFSGGQGNITFSSTNWVSPGWLPNESTELGTSYDGTITGTNTFFVDPNNNPGFLDPSAGDYHLTATSNAIGIAGSLDPSWPAVDQEYAPPTSDTPRASVADVGAFQAAPLIPTLIGVTPLPNASDLSVTTSLTANFNEPVQAGTIGFTLMSGDTSVPATLSYNDTLDTATLTPTAPLAASTTYTAIVSDAENESGTTMVNPYSWFFTTTSNTLIPTVTSQTPAGNATGVAVSSPVSATFNEGVQADTIAFTLTSGAGISVPGSLSYDSTTNTETFTPNAALAYGTTYTATVSGAEDTVGDSMSGTVTWSFTTEGDPSDPVTASLIERDTTTQGNWIGAYGAQGYDVIGNAASFPNYADVTPSGQSSYTWAASTSDPRALQDAVGTGRIAAAWYAGYRFTVDVNLIDGQAHDLELYFVDWDGDSRSEQVQISSATTGVLLDTETISSFNSGIYLDWNVSGNLVITITRITGPNAVLSGLFFDPPSSPVLPQAPTITWSDPASILYGTALSGSQLDATASVPGTFTYSPSLGTVLGAGDDQTLSVSFAPTDTTDYTDATFAVTIDVLQAAPTITWPDPADITYGTPLSNTQLDATASWTVGGVNGSVAGTFTYTPGLGTVLGAGDNQVLSVSFAPTDTTDYTSATFTATIDVLQAAPTITWSDPADILYGTALSGSQLDATASVPGTFTYTPGLGTVLHAGDDQTLSVSFAPTDTTDYTGATFAVTIDVLQATPTIAWPDPADIVYGTPLSNTQLDATASWTVGGVTGSVAGTFTYTPAAGIVLGAGDNQTLSVSFAPTDTTDYTDATFATKINVLQATPTITWSAPANILYGTALSGSQLDATASVPGTFIYTPGLGTVLHAGDDQTLSVSFAPTDKTDYTGATFATKIDVLQATPTIAWSAPAAIVYGTPLSNTQLDATSSWTVGGVTGSVAGTFTYMPAAGTVLGAGDNQTLSVSFAPTDKTDYTGATFATKINVLQATPTITWSDPADILYGTALSGSQLDATAKVPGTFTYSPGLGTVLHAGDNQTLSVSFAPMDTTDYTGATFSVTIDVLQATPTIAWPDPADIIYGTPLSNTQLDSTSSWTVGGVTGSVAGTFTYSPAAGTVLGAGDNQVLSVSFAPTDTTDYTGATFATKIDVLQATPTITWSDPADILYGTALSGSQLDATAKVPGTFTYTPGLGTVLHAGDDQTLSVSFAPTDKTDYTGATFSVTIDVLQATPTIAWSAPAAIVYGTPLSNTQLDATSSWTVGGVTGSVAGTFTYTPAAGTVLHAGDDQTLSVSFIPTDTTDYVTASATTTIDVLQATPTITWSAPANILYGTALSGSQLDATAKVSGTFTYSPGLGTVLHAGDNQTLSVSFAPTDTTDYTGATFAVTIDVLQATPTIAWPDPANIVYGTPLSNTQLDATSSWTVGGVTGSVAGTFTYTPAAGTVLGAGDDQTLSVSFAPTDKTDYTGATFATKIDVLQATPTIAWPDPANIVYGTPLSNTQLDATSSWTVGGVTGSVAGTFTYSPAAGTVLNAGNGQTLSVSFIPTDSTDYTTAIATTSLNVLPATPRFGGLTPSQAIFSGIGSISLAGTLTTNTSVIPPGNVSITIDGATQTATVQANGSFAATFNTLTIPVSTTPYPITYAYAGGANFSAASDASTSLTVVAATFAAVSPNPRNTPVSTIVVSLSDPIITSVLTSADLSLTDNGGPNLIAGPVSLTGITGGMYEIGGLSGLTAAQGLYSLTLNAAGLRDQAGNTITGSLSTSWLMDTTPPASTVSPLAKVGTSLSFPITVTGTVPTEPAGSPTVDITSFAVYVSTNSGAWNLWQTLTPVAGTPNTATANFTGASNTVYAFYTTATDNAGNTQAYNPTIEASTDLPNLNTPVTHVASSSSYNSANGTFTLNLTGTDANGSGLAYFEVYVVIDAQTPVLIGPAIPAGVADSTGTYHASISYGVPLADGVSHTYQFYSIGIDAAGLEEATHPAPYDATFSASYIEPTLSQLAVTGLTVENGAAERSYIRYLDLNFNESSSSVLQAIVNSVNDPTDHGPPELTLTQYSLEGGGSGIMVSLKGLLTVIDNAIEIDFGAGGIGGNAGTTTSDGYYSLSFAPQAGQGQAATHHFYRLLGDVNGDGTVDQNDLTAIAAARGQSVSQIAAAIGQPAASLTALSMDVNGDGSVNTTDLALATKSKGRSVASNLPEG
jgi:hypothetical protein